MRILSWNVNGLRACVRKGFHDFLDSSEADIIGLQEVRAFEHQLEPRTRAPEGWHASLLAGGTARLQRRRDLFPAAAEPYRDSARGTSASTPRAG